MSASQRWRRKKDGESDSKEGNRQQVTELTELANRLLTRTGNMNIYQESYEHIAKLVGIASPLLGGGICVSHYLSHNLPDVQLCRNRHTFTSETHFVSRTWSFESEATVHGEHMDQCLLGFWFV